MRASALCAALVVVLAQSASADEKPVLVVYDFTSAFDGGKMGEWTAEIVRGHASRTGRYVGNPKITVEEVLGKGGFRPTGETAPGELARFTRKEFDADLFVYGSVVEAGGGYRVLFRVYRATKEGAAEKILDETRDCPARQHVPLAVDGILKDAAGVRDAPTEWSLLAGELKECRDGLAEPAGPGVAVAVDARTRAATASYDKLVARMLNVSDPANRDFASKALLEYLDEVVEACGAVANAPPARRPAAAGKASDLARCLALSIDNWLDQPAAEKRWNEGKNLVINGGFEFGQEHPANWEPLKQHMSWVPDPDGKSGKVVKFDMPRDVAASTGMLLYSQAYAVEPGATYRLRWRFRTTAPAVKLFIKGYDEFPKGAGFEPQEREVWRSRKDPQYRPGQLVEYTPGQWTEYGHDFEPFVVGRTDPATGLFAASAKQPRCIRLMLYAYWPAGVVYWDDIVVKKIKDAPVRPKPAE